MADETLKALGETVVTTASGAFDSIKSKAEEVAPKVQDFLTGDYGQLDETVDMSQWNSIWANYDYTNHKSNLKSNLPNLINYGKNQAINVFSYGSNQDITIEDMRGQWITFGNNFVSSWSKVGEAWNSSDDSFGSKLKATLEAGLNGIMDTVCAAMDGVMLGASQALNVVKKYGSTASESIESWIYDQFGTASMDAASELAAAIDSYGENLGQNSVFMSVIQKGLSIFSDGAFKAYKNGVDETSFGRLMESSWSKSGSTGFLSLIDKQIVFNQSTPFDSGETMSNLYGKMLLGVPPLFTNITDPKNRTMASTFVRDAKFLTLTPGFPQYNGSNMLLKENQDQYHQTSTAKSMLEYLLKNGLDKDSFEKDKRYYTFKTNYEEYYSYLETMLNTLWIKMGLATTDNNKYSMYTFFEDPSLSTDTAKLKPQYQTSFGFFVNPVGTVTESISNQSTSFGSSLAGEVNDASETYQRINFLTGMGTGGDLRNKEAMASKSLGLVTNIKNFMKDVASNTISAVTNGPSNVIAKIAAIAGGVVTDARHFTTEIDPGASLQAFATTNGMRVVYPELWQDSTMSRSISINFEFISPYGDPLSIFQYVIAPFCALLTYAMPRQAADNGYVSPFFVRADIPGLFTADLAMISDFNWSRGGNNDLWTKDGLPRAISGSFTIQDLYPYLAMTKRISFLSANPNYTTFLDNLASLHAINTSESNDALNDYWKALLNRVNGEDYASGLYNRYTTSSRLGHVSYANKATGSRLGGTSKSGNSSPWLRGIN